MSRKHALTVASVGTLAAVALAGTAVCEPPDYQVDLEAMQCVMSPGPQHDVLGKLVGEWDSGFKIWWAGPEGPPMESTGTTSIKWVLGGRFIMEEGSAKFSMPDAQGKLVEQTFDAIRLTGHDNNRKAYVSTWVDSASTQIMSAHGAISQDGKTITQYGQMDEPMLGLVDRYVKYVTTIVSEDKFVVTAYDLHVSDDYKVVEATYTRKPEQADANAAPYRPASAPTGNGD